MFAARILVRRWQRRRDYKSRCRLGSKAFGIPWFTPESNVHDRWTNWLKNAVTARSIEVMSRASFSPGDHELVKIFRRL